MSLVERALIPKRLALLVIDSFAWVAAIVMATITRFTLAESGVRWSSLMALLATIGLIQLAGFIYQARSLGTFRIGSADEVIVVTRFWLVTALIAVAVNYLLGTRPVPTLALVLSLPLALTTMLGVRLGYRVWRDRMLARSFDHDTDRVLVYGAGEGGESIIRSMMHDPAARLLPVGILDDDPDRMRASIHGVKVLGGRRDLSRLADELQANVLLIAIPSAPRSLVAELDELAKTIGLEVKVLPSTGELLGRVGVDDIRSVEEGELLDYDEVSLDHQAIMASVAGRRVLVTGAGGVVGRELCRQILRLAPAQLTMLDRDESALQALQLHLTGDVSLHDPSLVVADVRDRERILSVFDDKRPDLVFHAAALTNHSLLESHPDEGYKTNVDGTRNIVDAAVRRPTTTLINLSSFDATDPTTVLGATQLQAERVVTAASLDNGQRLMSIRFGTIPFSAGSFLSNARHQIEAGRTVDMPGELPPRLMISAVTAAGLVLQAGAIGRSAETLIITAGETIAPAELAQRLVDLSNAPVAVQLQPEDESGTPQVAQRVLGIDEVGVVRDHPDVLHVAGSRTSPSFADLIPYDLAGKPRASGSTDDSRILLSAPDVGEAERQGLVRAFDSGWIAPLGPEVDAFEQELADYVGAESCVALASGTAAIQLGLIALGLEPGDEVVVQTATFAATAFSVVHAGGVPIFGDVDWNTWNLDPVLLDTFLEERNKHGRLPKAIVAVDLYGMHADYERLSAVCDRFGIPLIEDAAESLGSISRGRMGGSRGTLGVVSFNGNKIITTSGGGALFGTTDLTDHVRHLATQARQPALHYEHTEIGYNARLSNLLAGMGRVQLAGLEPRIARRTEIFERYRSELPAIEWLPHGVTERPNHWLSVGLLPRAVRPADLCEQLATRGIEARPAWKPMHAQRIFENNISFGGDVADEIFRRGICLPSGSAMTRTDQDRVLLALHDLFDLTEPADRAVSVD